MNGGDSSGSEPRGRERVELLVDRLTPQRLHRWREQVHYLAVGGWNTVFGYAVFAALYALLHHRLHVDWVLVISYAIGIANNYITFKVIVFRSRERVSRELPRFAVVYLITLAVNLVVLPLALRAVSLNAYVVQAIFTLGVVIVSYFANKHFGFRQAGRRAREAN